MCNFPRFLELRQRPVALLVRLGVRPSISLVEQKYYLGLYAFAILSARGWWGTSKAIFSDVAVVKMSFQPGAEDEHRRVVFSVSQRGCTRHILVTAVASAQLNADLIEHAVQILERTRP